MGTRLKPLNQQVMVITGATSGIGLVTARRAAAAGARLAVSARSREALQELTDELRGEGVHVVSTVADVGREEDVQRISDAAIDEFGGYDTWINNATAAIYGKVEEVTLADQRRLFETTYWGVVNGSRIACRHLREHGGKLINVGSVLSDRALPLQGAYSAAKAAVMGFTDALRMELEQDGAPVSVTLIKPGTIDTPYQDRAASYLATTPRNPPPVYDPEPVAKAILYAATHDRREIVVGGGGRAISLTGRMAPRLTDRLMERWAVPMQHTRRREPGIERKQLHRPGTELSERGGYSMTLHHSLYTAAVQHKIATAGVGLAAVALIYGLMRARARPTV